MPWLDECKSGTDKEELKENVMNLGATMLDRMLIIFIFHFVDL